MQSAIWSKRFTIWDRARFRGFVGRCFEKWEFSPENSPEFSPLEKIVSPPSTSPAMTMTHLLTQRIASRVSNFATHTVSQFRSHNFSPRSLSYHGDGELPRSKNLSCNACMQEFFFSTASFILPTRELGQNSWNSKSNESPHPNGPNTTSLIACRSSQNPFLQSVTK